MKEEQSGPTACAIASAQSQDQVDASYWMQLFFPQQQQEEEQQQMHEAPHERAGLVIKEQIMQHILEEKLQAWPGTKKGKMERRTMNGRANEERK